MAKLPLDSSYEGIPPASESKGSLGAQRIRETRENARYPHQTEANVGSVAAGYTNDGRHSKGSARAFLAAAAPTTLLKPDGTTALTTAEMPSGTLADGNPISASLGATDDGRIWVDTSGIHPRLHYWDGTGWVGMLPTENGFINGQFKVNQRTAFAAPETAATTKTYWFDRWYTIHTTGAGTVNRETATLPTGSISNVGIKVIGGAATTVVRLGQRLESQRAIAFGAGRAANVRVTISGKIRNTGANPITLSLLVDAANAVDNFAAVTNVVTSAAIINALAAGASQSFSLTVDIGTAAAGTPSNGLDVYLLSTAPNPFPAGENFVVTDMQFEVGRVVTKARPEDFKAQLDLCKRFYQKTFSYATKPAQAAGRTDSLYGYAQNNHIEFTWMLGAELRTTPTVTTYSTDLASSQWYNVTDLAAWAAATATAGTKNIRITGDGGTSNRVIALHASADAEL